MADEPIANCQLRLREDLDEVLAVLNFSTSAFKTYASSGDILAWVAQQPELHAVVREFRAATSLTDLNFIFQSLYVQTWSAFELFIRTIIVSYLEEVCARASDFDSLKKAKLIERNLYHTGIALQKIFENRSHFVIIFLKLHRRLEPLFPRVRR